MILVDKITVELGGAIALSGISFEVSEGEVYAILGPNGAGKTTLLESIMGLRPLTDGNIYCKGEMISVLPTHNIVQKGVVLIPEGGKIFPKLTVLENLLLGGRFLNTPNEKMEEVFELFPFLGDRVNEKADKLSGGEQQMLSIGRGLMTEPKVILMDEPSQGLSPRNISRIKEALKKIKGKEVTMLIAAQKLDMISELADRGNVLVSGKMEFSGKIDSLLKKEKLREFYLM